MIIKSQIIKFMNKIFPSIIDNVLRIIITINISITIITNNSQIY